MARSLKRKGARTETESIHWYVTRLLFHVPFCPSPRLSPIVPNLITQRPLHVLNPTKHFFYNLNRCHSRRIRRQGTHTGQIRTSLILLNERRTRTDFLLDADFPPSDFPPSLYPDFVHKTRSAPSPVSDVCLTSFPFVFIEDRFSKRRMGWLRVEEV